MKTALLLALVIMAGCAPHPLPTDLVIQSDRPSPLASDIILFTSISTPPRGIPTLQVSLYNMNPTGMNVVTGMDHYPLGLARFHIRLKDHRIFELFCDDCGGGGIAPGRSWPYIVHLGPNQKWGSEVPLTQFLYVDSRDQHLDSVSAKRADLITSLPWSRWKSGDEQGTEQKTLMGTATSTVALPVFSRADTLKLRAAGAYSKKIDK